MKNMLTLLLLVCTFGGSAQNVWKGKKAGVVLTYDDAIDQHLDNALPVLDSLQLKASFYVTAFSPSVQKRMQEWKQLASSGHELGNHTLYHPCIGDSMGRSWVPADYDLKKYTVKRLEDEVRMTNLFLQALDGKTERTFAYTCGDKIVKDSAFIEGMRKDFVAARSVINQMSTINNIDLYNVDCYMVNNQPIEEMIGWVDKAIEKKALLVILFHGVGGGNGLDISLTAHRQLLLYIKKREKDLYIAPLIDMAKHIKQWQSENPRNRGKL